MGCLWVRIYTSTLAWYGRPGTRIPFYNMLQMARLEVQFGDPDNNKKYDSEMSPFRREILKALHSRKPLYII